MAATWTDPVDRADGYVVGQTVYNQLLGDTGDLQFLYERAINIVKADDETVNGSATLQNDDDFAITVTAGYDYFVEMTLLIATGTTPDWKFAWTLTGMTWDGVYTSALTGGQPGAPVDADNFAVASAAATAVLATGAATSSIWKGRFIIHAGGSGGTLNFQWAQNTSNGSDTKVLENSLMVYRQLGAS